jgi:hypothetical protein
VGGVTCLGFGGVARNEPAHGSATPTGILRLLRHDRIPSEGKLAVVVGRSLDLGKPLAVMLLNANATVMVCHSRTQQGPARTGDYPRPAPARDSSVGRGTPPHATSGALIPYSPAPRRPGQVVRGPGPCRAPPHPAR